jgi:hypothetical protein
MQSMHLVTATTERHVLCVDDACGVMVDYCGRIKGMRFAARGFFWAFCNVLVFLSGMTLTTIWLARAD